MILKPFIKTNINIVNLKGHEPTEFDFYCGRPSILGNPYTHSGKSKLAKYIVSSRDEAITSYNNYLQQHKDDVEFVDIFNDMLETYRHHGELNLCCWCFPKRCHCEYIKAHLESMIYTQ